MRSFLKKGVEYTESLLEENESLRAALEATEAENSALLAQIASDDAIRDLLKSIERLESERRALLERSHLLEHKREEHEHRHSALEVEMSTLANLYVASFQLHTSLSVRRVLRGLHDMLGQFVGAKSFVIYIVDDTRGVCVPFTYEGVAESDVREIPLGEGRVGEACMTGLTHLRSSDLQRVDRQVPVGVVPFIVDGVAVGAVEIVRLLEQKTAWAPMDHELFELFSAHAGISLIAANLYVPSKGPRAALAGVAQKLAPKDG